FSQSWTVRTSRPRYAAISFQDSSRSSPIAGLVYPEKVRSHARCSRPFRTATVREGRSLAKPDEKARKSSVFIPFRLSLLTAASHTRLTRSTANHQSQRRTKMKTTIASLFIFGAISTSTAFAGCGRESRFNLPVLPADQSLGKQILP